MAIQVASFIIPKNGNLWYILDDKFIRGGLHVVPTIEDRDAIPDTNRKQGMLAIVQTDGKVWSLQEDMLAWKEFKVGGSNAVRMSVQKTIIGIAAQERADFTISLGGTAIIYSLDVSDVCQVEAFETAARAELNPYRFVATSDHLKDDGQTLMTDGTILRGRRYHILTNQETEPSADIYFRITNLDALPAPPVSGEDIVAPSTKDITLTISFLSIEGAYEPVPDSPPVTP